MTDFISTRELQHELPKIARRVRNGHRLKVLRYGKPLFTIIPNEESDASKTHAFADFAKLSFRGDRNLSRNIDDVLYGKKV